uniref:Rx N-terminal domain-containing protein n=1 Tax=Fagus sylvatica TaxID=28930 RepID=A0A2N9FNW9_FAGSY
MAEAIPFGLVQKIIERLGSTAFKEIGSIWGVKDELEKLKNSVSTIQAVLLDAEEQQDKNHQVEDWLMKLRDAVYDADDLLSYFSTEELRRKVMGGDEMAKKVRTFFSSSNQLTFGYKMNGKIKVIRGRLDAIASDRNKFQFVERPLRKRVVTRERDQTHSFILEEEVIGREDEKETIIDMLLNTDEEDQNVSFISIVGIGGLGKTTLAQYVYNDEKVKTYFDLKMWVCISDVFDVKTIAEKIIGCATGTKVKNLEMEQVQIKLREKLNQKYLLVLDDVWNDEAERWSNLKRLLMGGSKGSKVMITTRSNKVAEITSTISSSIFLKGLSENQSWSLLKKMAFKKGQESINPTLKEIGMEILKKCCGVPLAIKTIGRILYFNETDDEWLHIKDKDLTNVTQGENDILPTLKLSYDNLPSHLKCCFAYCSLFPKDYEIPKLRLIQLWIAQGFIRSSDEKVPLEDVGNEYCKDLLWRKLKELPRDIQKLISLKHLEIDGCESLTHMPCGIGQLTSLQTLPLFVVSKDLKASSSKHCGGLAELNKLNNLRGELCIKNLAWVTDATLEAKAANLKEKRHLRSLELSWDSKYNNDTYISNDENLLEGLQPYHTLKKLNVKGYRGIQCANIYHHCVNSHLSENSSLDKMIGLEYITDREITDEFSASTTFFPSLKSLKLWDCPNLKGWWRRDIVDAATTTSISSDQYQQHISLPSFPCLSDLDIQNCNNLTCMPLFPYLEESLYLRNTSFKPLQETMAMTMNMSATSSLPSYSSSSPPLSKLKSLILFDIQDVESLPEELLKNLASLQRLHISDCPNLTSLPEGIGNLTSLQRLRISGCPNLTSLPEGIGNLTSLQSLDISNCLNLTSLSEGISNLTSLQILHIFDCPNLTSLLEGIGNLTSLQRLRIFKCPNLASLPEGIGNLTSLQSLDISGCPNLTSLPEGIGNLTSLQTLDISDCLNLTSLPEGISNLTSLQRLHISDCPNLTSLPEGIGNLTSLQSLLISDCPNLTSLPEGIDNLTSLQSLLIFGCPNLTSLPEGIGNLTSLQSLLIFGCPNLTSLPEGIGNLTSLQDLEIYKCHNLTSIPEVLPLFTISPLSLPLLLPQPKMQKKLANDDDGELPWWVRLFLPLTVTASLSHQLYLNTKVKVLKRILKELKDLQKDPPALFSAVSYGIVLKIDELQLVAIGGTNIQGAVEVVVP